MGPFLQIILQNLLIKIDEIKTKTKVNKKIIAGKGIINNMYVSKVNS